MAASSEQEHPARLQEATVLLDQVRLLFDNGRYREALAPAQKALAVRELLLGPNHEDVAAALTRLGLIHSTLIQFDRGRPMLERALDMRTAIFGAEHPLVADSLTNLGALLYAAGEYTKAIDLLKKGLAIRERTLGPTHPDVGVTLSHLAIAQRALSRLTEAQTSVERAITILRAADPARPRDLGMAVNVAGNILGRVGEFERARALMGESIELYRQASGPRHPHVGGALVQLAMLEGRQGHHAAALPLLEQGLSIMEPAYGANNPEIAGVYYEIGLAERALGRLDSAERRFKRALAIQQETIDLGHPNIALSLIELADIMRQRGESTAARELLQRAVKIQEQALGRDHTSVAQSLTILGYLEALNNNLAIAELHFDRAEKIREQALGLNHRDVAASLLDLARAKHALGKLSEARPLYETARRIIRAQSGKNPGLDDEALSRIWKRDLKGLQDYAVLLAMLARSSKEDAEQQSAVAEGFAVTQEARGWLIQSAIARSLAQRDAGSAPETALARRVEELKRFRQDTWNRMNDLYALPEQQRDAKDMAAVKERLQQVQIELDRTTAKLRAAAPRYAELAQPEALDLKAAQDLLQDNEALVSFYTLYDRVQIWVLRNGRPVTYREASIGKTDLVDKVSKLRASLKSAATPFEIEIAATLHEVLFGSIAAMLTGTEHLILVPDDVLLPLPFPALVTQRSEAVGSLADLARRKQVPRDEELTRYSIVPWLARAYALTILPSASALKLLRHRPVATGGSTERFLGFGDPVFHGEGHDRGGTMPMSRGTRVSVDTLRALNSLPGTREELLTVAKALDVDPDTSVFLGQRATEPEVRRLNESGRLGQAKVVSFATHGLLAGEVQGITQPALVLTPPEKPTDENDGLLSLEEVLQLKLPNTDWVILSACNTAGDDGSGESLSGLARAFFFAGAKALLVSQWSVDDLATKTLMEEIFRRYGSAPSVPPAKALREGMLTLLDHATKNPDHRYFAHPYAWAPFMLVGDGLPLRPK